MDMAIRRTGYEAGGTEETGVVMEQIPKSDKEAFRVCIPD
jgi:hypothetical protein